MNNTEYETARTEYQQATAALAISRRKSSREFAWDWANTAARHAEKLGISNARDLLGVNNWPEINALDAALAQIRKNELLIVTRHGGLVDWLKSKGYDGRVVDRATPADILGKHVIGSLPLHYSAIAASITSIAIPGCPQNRRGEELSAEELDMYGAFLRTYVVKEITMIEPI